MSECIVEPITCERIVALTAADAFRFFTSRFGDWWPRDYTFSKNLLAGIYLGHAVGEWCYEQGPLGFRCDWGRVLQWDPPHGLAVTWQIGPKSILQPDPDQCTEVRITFGESAPGESRIVLTHEYFERHGADGAGYRAEMASEYGWPLLLQAFAARAVTGG